MTNLALQLRGWSRTNLAIGRRGSTGSDPKCGRWGREGRTTSAADINLGLQLLFRIVQRTVSKREIVARTCAVFALVALTGCATTRYVTVGCLTQSQYNQLAAAKPGKIHSQLNGQADHDEKLIAGRLIRVEAWGDGELTILGGCITKDAH